MATNKEEISDYIRDIMTLTPEEEKSDMAEFIATEAAIWGSFNLYEGVGILEVAKSEYMRVGMEILAQEAKEMAEHGCKDCRCHEEIPAPIKKTGKDVN